MPKVLRTRSVYPVSTSLEVFVLRSRINSHPKYWVTSPSSVPIKRVWSSCLSAGPLACLNLLVYSPRGNFQDLGTEHLPLISCCSCIFCIHFDKELAHGRTSSDYQVHVLFVNDLPDALPERHPIFPLSGERQVCQSLSKFHHGSTNLLTTGQ